MKAGDLELQGTLDVNDNNIIGKEGVSVTGGDGAGGDVNIVGGAATDIEALQGAQSSVEYYDNLGNNGTFFGGTSGYVALDTITLSDGSTLTVSAVSSGVVTTFAVDTSGETAVTQGVALTQTGTSGVGTGFTLTPELNNVTGSQGGDLLLTPGVGAGLGLQPGTIILGGTLNVNDFNIVSPVKNSATTHDINIIAGRADNDETTSNDVNITGGEMDYDGGGTVVAGDVNITGGGLLHDANNATGGSVNIVGASLPNQTASDDYGTAGSVNITGGNVPDAANTARGGVVNITGGNAYSTPANSFGGDIHIKAGEGYDFPGEIILEPGGSYGSQTNDIPSVVIQASSYAGTNYGNGGYERTTVLRFQGLQSNSTVNGATGHTTDNFVGLKAPDNIGASPFTLTLPTSDSTGTQALVSNGSGTLSWASINPTATTAELTAIANAINTTALKVAGWMVFNTTTGAPVWSVGSADGSLWNDATGATAHTPV